ncbi:MAG: TolC family protein [Methylococcales bacterium]|nr:TolC family protein [Methylococcales bacterium]
MKRTGLMQTLVMITALPGCAAYFNDAPKPELSAKAQARLVQEEALALPPAKTTLEQALPRFRQQAQALEKPPQLIGDLGVIEGAKPHGPGMTLAQARALALANNLKLKVALMEPGIAETFISQEEAKFDDLIFAHAKYSRKDSPLLDGDVVSFKSVDKDSPLNSEIAKLNLMPQDTEKLDFEAGILIPLRSGGKIKLAAPLAAKKTDRFVPSEQYVGAVKFSMSQPLLRGAGIDANVAGIRLARYQKQMVDLKTRLQSIRVLAEVDKAYWSVYAAWGALDIARQQYDLARQNLAMVKRRVDAGLTANIEINRAEIGVAERMESLIIASTDLKLKQRKLKLLLNDPDYGLDSEVMIAPETEPTLLEFDFDREQLAEQALDQRLELLELELKLAADSTKIDYLRNQTLPLFMLDYSFGLSARDQAFDDAFADVLSQDNEAWSVGVRLEIPLTNELRKSKLRRAVRERLQRLSTQQLKIMTVRREIFDALDRVEQHWQRILANRQSVILAGVNYQAEIKQFQSGIRTMTEVLETLTKLGKAQVKEVKAIADYQAALIDLAYVTGTLLGYSKVGFDSVNAL